MMSDSDVELAVAREVVRALMRPPAAGPYASRYRVLMEVNNVGGAAIGIMLSRAQQRRTLRVTAKRFTGNIRQLGTGENIEFVGRATVLVFRPGSIEVMGARSPDLVRILVHKVCARLCDFGEHPSIRYMSIDNKVATGNIGHFVSLERLHKNLPDFMTDYEPLWFPGVVCTYAGEDPRHEKRVVTFLVFENGKVMGLGINDIYKANEIYVTMMAVMDQFKAVRSLETQRNKSTERAARKRNKESSAAASSSASSGAASGRGMLAKAQALATQVQDFLAANRSQLGTTAFAASLKEHLDRIVREGAKRNQTAAELDSEDGGGGGGSDAAAVVTDDDDNDNDDDDEEPKAVPRVKRRMQRRRRQHSEDDDSDDDGGYRLSPPPASLFDSDYDTDGGAQSDSGY